jgi:D-arginine dehydrogenase
MMYDFIVVGAGIAGGSLAYELAQCASVCLIEGEVRPGFHATGRSAALFAPSYGGAQIRALTRASRNFFDRPPPGFCQHPLLTARGCLYIARTGQSTRLAAMVGAIRGSGGKVAMIDVGEALARVPRIRAEYLAAAAWDSDAMDIDVDALHQGFLRGARSAGAWSIELDDGAVSAPVLVNAAGAWADELAEACGARRVGLQALRRTAVLVDAPAGVDTRQWPAVIDADEQFYFKPESAQLLLSPADEIPQKPCDAYPEELDIAVAVDRVQAALDIDVRKVNHSWAGLRTFAADRVPVVGFDARTEGLFWCAGQGGYGIQTAPALARTAAALAKRENLPADIATEGLTAADLSPGRLSAVSVGGGQH